ncbi:hypothetical protein CCP2SC5_150002 [Azospirillaceae bacterium]
MINAWPLILLNKNYMNSMGKASVFGFDDWSAFLASYRFYSETSSSDFSDKL